MSVATGAWCHQAKPRRPGDHALWPAPARVLDPPWLDQAVVDGCLLVGFADTGQVREVVRPVSDRTGIEPGLKLAQDLLALMKALSLRPAAKILLPAEPGLMPLRAPLAKPPSVW